MKAQYNNQGYLHGIKMSAIDRSPALLMEFAFHSQINMQMSSQLVAPDNLEEDQYFLVHFENWSKPRVMDAIKYINANR